MKLLSWQPRMAYCDFIAHKIRYGLESFLNAKAIHGVGLDKLSTVKWDLSPEGYLVSTKKTMYLQDHNGTSYKITVEEVDEIPQNRQETV